MTKYTIQFVVPGALALLAGMAHAQAVPPDPGSASRRLPQIEEIIVTARKVEENIQDTPLSVTAFTAADIEQLGMVDLADIAKRVPGLYFADFGDAKLSPSSMRGVVAGVASAARDPAVGIYVDEVFVDHGSIAAFDLYDTDRVEVLRGPQGTLYGRNTIAGVISLKSKRPADTFEGSAELTYGNYDYIRAGAFLSGPLVSGRLSGKISAVSHQRGGFFEDVWLNVPVNTEDHWTVRGQLLFTPSDNTELLLTGEYYKLDQHPLGFETLAYNEAADLPFLLDLFGLPRNTDPWDRKVYADAQSQERLTLKAGSALFKAALGDADLTSVTAYRTSEYWNRTDSDRSPISIAYDGDPDQVDLLSQEVRVAWSSGTFDWLLGAFYYKRDTYNSSFVEVGTDLADIIEMPELAGFIAGSFANGTTRSFAGFASATWRASEKLDFTFGGRYTRDKKTSDFEQFDPLGLLGGIIDLQHFEGSWSKFTPMVSARYRFTPDVMGYATVADGFKSGGFNDNLATPTTLEFGPEIVRNYELGLKSELLDRRVVANVALYYMDWSHIQIAVRDPDPENVTARFVFLDAGRAHSAGIEVDLQAVLTDRFRLGLAASKQQARFDEGIIPGSDTEADPDGIPLKEIPYTPDYQVDAWLEYRVPLSHGDLILLGEAQLRGSLDLEGVGMAIAQQGDTKTYNASVAYEAKSGRWNATLWGRNLGDTVYKTRYYDLFDVSVVGQNFIGLPDPRTYGLTVRVNF